VGSQRQAVGRTVQQELETAAQRLFGAENRISLAGRTDSGTHARGQVAAVTVATRLEDDTVGRALNAHLPGDVAVRDVREVDLEFDPRRWARKRAYRYTIANTTERQPLTRRRAWHVPGSLDTGAMQRAAGALIGRRDFSACSGPVDAGRTTIRTVFAATWQRTGCAVLFDIEADAFLPQMVRRLAGAFVRVGRGSLAEEEFASLLERAELATIGPAAPAHGLCLERVWYDEGYMP
jgi:tRNA pseudouridine38-40 synthase